MQIFLRQATEADMVLALIWRSNPDIYKNNFYSQKEPLEWESHKQWWRSRNAGWKTFIIMLLDDEWFLRPIGLVNLGQLDHWNPEIGYLVGETKQWNKGVGTKAVALACDWLKTHGYEYCHTTVLQKNERSIKLLKKLGVKYLGKAREGEVWMTKKL